MKYKRLIQLLSNLRFVRDDKRYHPEENVLSHSLQSYRIARKESDDKALHVAALYHDVGKLIETNGHDKISVDILQSFGYSNLKVFWLIKNHMRVRKMISGEMKKLKKINELIHCIWLKELIHLRRCDAAGRKVNQSLDFDWGEVNSLLMDTNIRR